MENHFYDVFGAAEIVPFYGKIVQKHTGPEYYNELRACLIKKMSQLLFVLQFLFQ